MPALPEEEDEELSVVPGMGREEAPFDEEDDEAVVVVVVLPAFLLDFLDDFSTGESVGWRLLGVGFQVFSLRALRRDSSTGALVGCLE